MKRIICIMLVLITIVATAGCKNGCKKNKTNEDTPLLLASQELDKVFNPFFSSSAPDSQIIGMTQIGMLGAIATVLMLFEIPLPFAPSFYEIDFSEVPVLVGCFSMGPLAGALIELVKIILNFVINGTTTAGVGEVANYIIGISLCVPAGIIYKRNKSKKT